MTVVRHGASPRASIFIEGQNNAEIDVDHRPTTTFRVVPELCLGQTFSMFAPWPWRFYSRIRLHFTLNFHACFLSIRRDCCWAGAYHARVHRPNHDISPIDEEYDFPKMEAKRQLPAVPTSMTDHAILPSQQRSASRQGDAPGPARSNIPMLRRERRQQQREAESAANKSRSPEPQDLGSRMPALRATSRDGPKTRRTVTPVERMIKPTDKPRGQKDPRWDPMTGEIAVDSDKGRPSQVKPVEFARGLGISTMSSSRGSPGSSPEQRQPSRGGGSRNGVGAGIGTKFTAAMSDTDPAASAFIATRPGWRGASGRTAIVDPVHDNPEVEPLKIPPRSVKRSPPQPAATAAGVAGEENVAGGGEGTAEGAPEAAKELLGSGDGLAPMSSPPISPETLTGQQHQHQHQQKQQIGVNGTTPTPPVRTQAQAPQNTPQKGSLVSAIRKMMPSSAQRQSRLFSSSNNNNNDKNNSSNRTSGSNTPTPTVVSPTELPNTREGQPDQTQTQIQGYPSPPLSGRLTPGNTAGSAGASDSVGGSAPLNATTAFTAKISNGHASDDNSFNSHRAPPLQPQLPTTHSDHENYRTASGQIHRKEVGSAPGSAPGSAGLLNPNSSNHRPQPSFSSSVYSNPDDNTTTTTIISQPPQSQPTPRHASNPAIARLNTKILPNLPGAVPGQQDPSPYVQPPSRFSVTTYATSAHTDSPRDSVDVDAPPLPTPPKDLPFLFNKPQTSGSQTSATTAMNGESVLARKRPEMRGGRNKWDGDEVADEEPVKISLSKAWMTTAGANSAGINTQLSPPRTRKDAPTPRGPRELKSDTAATNKENRGGFLSSLLSPRSPGSGSDNSRPASIMSNMDKDLPPPPSQQASNVAPTTHDRITQLNSQLQDLANRRLNINRAIRQMTELMPQDNLLLPDDVRRKREIEKRKIEELQGKLADIQREEHELGMKLHRAYKKLDKQAEYEPTTLWVRRATGS